MIRPGEFPGGVRWWRVLASWAVAFALAAGIGLWIATSWTGGSGGGCVVENRFGGCVEDDPGQADAVDDGGGAVAGDGSEFDNARR